LSYPGFCSPAGAAAAAETAKLTLNPTAVSHFLLERTLNT